MIKYIGKKEVQAERMNEFEAVKLGYARPNEDNHEWREGYHVVYEDGYHSWSPANVFNAAYRVSETVLDRLVIEYKDLDEKRCKLGDFFGSENYRKLPYEQIKLLQAQYHTMISYLAILQLRIESLMPNGDCCEEMCHQG